MIEEMGSFMEEEKMPEEELQNVDMKNILANLKLCTGNPTMLTTLYTEILTDDNVLYILTKVSQNSVFMTHFPEFYEKNENGENVINCQQNSKYHRYGVFKHILYTIEYVGNNNPKINANGIRLLKWAMFLHDVGKPKVKSTNEDENDSFVGHDDASIEIARQILDRFDFSDYDKKVILTLIKYHDRYLNEGELTYDNLRFLAEELENKAELFNLLIEVKIADNKAKSIDVYNKFMVVVKKYYEFSNEYFSAVGYIETDDDSTNSQTGDEIITSNTDELGATENQENITNNIEIEDSNINNVDEEVHGIVNDKLEIKDPEDITDKEFENIYQSITNGSALKFSFQPIIELKKKEIFGYEIKPKLNLGKQVSIENVLKKSRDLKKHDRVQQLLFINTLTCYSKTGNKKYGFVKTDLPSYDSYVNKGRVFDIFDDTKIVMELNNYFKYNNVELKNKIQEIRAKQGYVLLDNYEENNLDITSLDLLNPDYIKYDIPKDGIDDKCRKYIVEMLTYCSSSGIRLILNHIDTQEEFDIIKECGADLVQGKYFAAPSEKMEFDISILNDEKLV